MTREEAIDIVRKNYPHVGVSGSQFETALQNLIPELRESEDEWIRKLLIWQVHRNIEDDTNDLAQSVYDGIKGHDPDLEESIEDWKKCLAWLEKQNHDGKKWITPAELNRLETLRYEAGYKAGFNVGVHSEAEKQKEQKPLEWSEEDKAMIKSILFVLESYVSHSESASSPSLITSYPTYYKEIDWLKSLPERFGLQPKQEWSEEAD